MNLSIYLTNSCNMACRYCAIAVNQGDPATIGIVTLKSAVDYFLNDVHGQDKEITFTGGEPLAKFSLLTQVLRHISKSRIPVRVTVQTNGTLLNQERLAILLGHGTRVLVSLDGCFGVNDAERIFAGHRQDSVYQEVFDRLARLPKGNLEILMTMTPGNAWALAAGVRSFFDLGFRKIHFLPDFFSPWGENELKSLDEQLVLIRRWLVGLVRGKGEIIESEPIMVSCMRLSDPGREQWWKKCDTLVLGDDGHFYSCHSSQMSPDAKSESRRIGNANEGVDWKKREEEIIKAGDYLDRVAARYKDHVHCPMLFYHSAGVIGSDAERLIMQADQVAGVFSRGLRDLVLELAKEPLFEKVYGPSLRGHANA